jgi:IS4 transposase
MGCVTATVSSLKICILVYQDERNRYFEFITNSMDSTAEEVAFLYKKRWGIELLNYYLKKITNIAGLLTFVERCDAA